MTIIVGDELYVVRFFSVGNPPVRGSSFDLTIGTIFDYDGKEINEPFRLEPGHMVQVVSSEVFNLRDTVTGHVTYQLYRASHEKGFGRLRSGLLILDVMAQSVLRFSISAERIIRLRSENTFARDLFKQAAASNTRLT